MTTTISVTKWYGAQLNPGIPNQNTNKAYLNLLPGWTGRSDVITIFKPQSAVSIPDGNTITQILLQLSFAFKATQENVTSGAVHYNISNVLQSWLRSDVTYNTRPQIDDGASYEEELPGTVSVGDYVTLATECNITNLAQSAAQINRGLAFSSDELYASSTEVPVLYGATLLITYEPTPPAPGKPILIEPYNGEFVHPEDVSAEDPLRFAWEFVPSELDYGQAKYQLETSDDGITFTGSAVTSADQEAYFESWDADAMYWRLRTQDTSGAWSPYSDVRTLRIVDTSDAPVITTVSADRAKPLIEWTTSLVQARFQIRIKLGGETLVDAMITTEEKSYQCPIALESGETYTIQLRIYTYSDYNSAWGNGSLAVNYIAPTAPTFITLKKKYSVELTITNTPPTESNNIYRLVNGEYVKIGTATPNGTFEDHEALYGVNTYKVGAMNADVEALSDAVECNLNFSGGVLCFVGDDGDAVPVKYNVEWERGGDFGGQLLFFAGRVRPVAEFSEHIARTISIAYETKSYDDYARIDDDLTARRIALYRDKRTHMYGLPTNVSNRASADAMNRWYQVRFVLNEIEYDGGIE